MDKHSRLKRSRNADLDLYHVRGCFGGKGSAPATPDYAAAATAQGAANKEAALVSGRIANPNITNPYGSRTVTFGGTQDEPTVNVVDALSPAGQARFDSENRIIGQLGTMAENGLNRVDQSMAGPLNLTGAGQLRTNVGPNNFTADRDLVTRSLIQRNQPFMDRERSQLDNQLRNQGVMPGTEAYSAAIDDLNRRQNDFNLGAIAQGGQEQSRLFGLDLSSAQFGNQARQQGIQEALMQRQLPLNEINALRTGAQVTMPQFQAYQSQPVGAAPIMQATQAQGQADINRYNAQQAGQNAFTSGVFGLGAAAIPVAFSDRRLKSNVQRVGTHRTGIGIYEYTIFGRRQRGVMADEVAKVMPEAVLQHPSGYLMVDYGRLQ